MVVRGGPSSFMSVTVTNEQFGFHRPESHQLSNDLTKARSLRSVQACFQVFFYLAIPR